MICQLPVQRGEGYEACSKLHADCVERFKKEQSENPGAVMTHGILGSAARATLSSSGAAPHDHDDAATSIASGQGQESAADAPSSGQGQNSKPADMSAIDDATIYLATPKSIRGKLEAEVVQNAEEVIQQQRAAEEVIQQQRAALQQLDTPKGANLEAGHVYGADAAHGGEPAAISTPTPTIASLQIESAAAAAATAATSAAVASTDAAAAAAAESSNACSKTPAAGAGGHDIVHLGDLNELQVVQDSNGKIDTLAICTQSRGNQPGNCTTWKIGQTMEVQLGMKPVEVEIKSIEASFGPASLGLYPRCVVGGIVKVRLFFFHDCLLACSNSFLCSPGPLKLQYFSLFFHSSLFCTFCHDLCQRPGADVVVVEEVFFSPFRKPMQAHKSPGDIRDDDLCVSRTFSQGRWQSKACTITGSRLWSSRSSLKESITSKGLGDAKYCLFEGLDFTDHEKNTTEIWRAGDFLTTRSYSNDMCMMILGFFHHTREIYALCIDKSGQRKGMVKITENRQNRLGKGVRKLDLSIDIAPQSEALKTAVGKLTLSAMLQNLPSYVQTLPDSPWLNAAAEDATASKPPSREGRDRKNPTRLTYTHAPPKQRSKPPPKPLRMQQGRRSKKKLVAGTKRSRGASKTGASTAGKKEKKKSEA